MGWGVKPGKNCGVEAPGTPSFQRGQTGGGKAIFVGPLTAERKAAAQRSAQAPRAARALTTVVLQLGAAHLLRVTRNMSEALRAVQAARQSRRRAHLRPCTALPLPCGELARSPRDGLGGKPPATQP